MRDNDRAPVAAQDVISGWQDICAANEIVLDGGIAVQVNGQPVAVFHTVDGFFAVSNRDPFSQRNVLWQGRVGDIRGKLVVAVPGSDRHFCLRTGICLEDMTQALSTWPVTCRDGRLLVARHARAA